VGEHWISSKKLLKLAQLYPLYCTMVLMAVTILENLLIKKVFAVNISNNNKYSGHCTLFWVFFFYFVEIGSISVITLKFFYLSGVTLKELLLLCGNRCLLTS